MSPYCPPKGLELTEDGCATIRRGKKFKPCGVCETYKGDTQCARCHGQEKDVGALDGSLLCSKCAEEVKEKVKAEKCQVCGKEPVHFKKHKGRPACCDRCYQGWKTQRTETLRAETKRLQCSVTEAGSVPVVEPKPSSPSEAKILAPDRMAPAAGVGAIGLLSQATEGFLLVVKDPDLPLTQKGNILEDLAATAANLSRAVRLRAERGM